MAKDDERRQHSRQPLSFLVQFRFDSFDDFHADYSVDLSPGGMFIQTDAPRPLGSIISFQFSFRSLSRLIEGEGKVVRVIKPGPGVASPGMGISFTQVDQASLALIAQLCAKNPSRPRSP